MSQNPLDRLLSCEDDEFVFRVDTDIRNYINNCKPDREMRTKKTIEKVKENETHVQIADVLLFPPVNSYRRFLIHKVCELVTSSQPKELTTFSIGINERRRTVVCQRYQLLAETEHDSLKRIQENEFTWNYLKRNSVSKHPSSEVVDTSMGVESRHLNINNKNLNTKFETRKNKDGDSSPDEIIGNSTNQLATRTRRPDRAFYVPRAKRSQTTPPSSTSSSSSNSQSARKSGKKSAKSQSKSIEQNSSEENFESDEESNSKDSVNFENKMNCGNLENEESIQKVDKVSQKMNSNDNKKQASSSDMAKNEASNGDGDKNSNATAVNQEDDDWDTLFDDNGDCLDPKMIEELTTAVGKVKIIEKPKQDYSAYHANMDLLKDEEFPHVLEVCNFPVDFKTEDLMMIFSQYKESGFDLKWVDDTHCLVIFSNARIAAEALTMCHPVVKLSPMRNSTQESRTKAKKCSNSLLPYKQRPETCAALAKRLVIGHLGIRNKTSAEEREKERKILREAKERKLLAAKQREESWN